MSDYDVEAAHRAAADANRRARREAAEDAADRARSLEATKRQIRAARGHDGTAYEPEYETDPAKMTTTQRQLLAARGIKPVKAEVDPWGDETR